VTTARSTSSATATRETLELGGISVEYVRKGCGAPLLVLHGEDGPLDGEPFVDRLAEHADVIAPVHPGFARSPRPAWCDSIDDLAYAYNGLLAALSLRDVVVAGISMGGWIAAEMAARSEERLAGIVLAGALGVKVSDRETRDIQDIFALSEETLNRLSYHDPARAPRAGELPDEELELFVRNREAAALYLWEPYAHNPKLLGRLQRLRTPCLVLWGESDGIAKPDYGRAYAGAIPGSSFALIPRAGHAVYREQPEALAAHVARFMTATS
jgi:pimeloyl-ACP methyl ester carboxylesterase